MPPGQARLPIQDPVRGQADLVEDDLARAVPAGHLLTRDRHASVAGADQEHRSALRGGRGHQQQRGLRGGRDGGLHPREPPAARGAGFGGMAGVILAGLSGPIGVGAIVGGAAIGAVSAALKDSGLKDKDLDSVSHLMAEGREGLVIVVPLEAADAFQAFMDGNVDFQAADRKLTADIVPGRTLQDAIDNYIEHEED